MVEAYDVVCSVSDLHLGGAEGFRIVHPESPGILKQALAALGREAANRRVLLVLNGDTIDTLAEGDGYVHIDDGVKVFAAIATNAYFRPFFEGLAAFVAARGATLAVSIGNHDLELALPEVQARFVALLTTDLAAGPDAAARVRFTPAGLPVCASVGGRKVYITHGNEIDKWNVVDLNTLAWAVDRRIRGLPFDPTGWKPNAGTRLVIDVMNTIKREYPFVDLLKPEMDLAVPLLVALKPGVFRKLPEVLPIAGQMQATPARRLGGLLKEAERPPSSTDLLASAIAALPVRPQPVDWLKRADDRAKAGLQGTAMPDGELGLGKALFQAIFADLRAAMRSWVREGAAFNPTALTAEDEGVIDRMGAEVAVVIAGHTHLARSTSFPFRNLVYLNTGTWARLIQLAVADVDRDDRWAEVQAALGMGGEGARMADLDAPLSDGRPLATTLGYVAVVERRGDTVAVGLWNPKERPHFAKRGGVGAETEHTLSVVE